jgi:putative effector of murein hydrolase LrgA (UPF0299 family)
MKYVIAIVACVAVAVAYAIIGALLDWKGAGGIIPMMILFAILGATWTAITKRGHEPESKEKKED